MLRWVICTVYTGVDGGVKSGGLKRGNVAVVTCDSALSVRTQTAAPSFYTSLLWLCAPRLSDPSPGPAEEQLLPAEA